MGAVKSLLRTREILFEVFVQERSIEGTPGNIYLLESQQGKYKTGNRGPWEEHIQKKDSPH